jgi:G3E family GTPase
MHQVSWARRTQHLCDTLRKLRLVHLIITYCVQLPFCVQLHCRNDTNVVQITVVDSHTFIQEFACRNPIATRPDLGGDQSMFRPVVDLLVEQIEVADYVLLNKVDLLGEQRLPELEAIIKSINPLCQVMTCSHGKACHWATFLI